MRDPIVINDAYLDENILSIISLLQKEGYFKRYEETLLKVVESFILDEDLPPDEQWQAVRILSELRRDLRDLAAKGDDKAGTAPEII